MDHTSYYLHIAADQLSATLCNRALGEEDLHLEFPVDLALWLADAGIVHGIAEDAVSQAQVLVNQGNELTTPLILAHGTPPVAGFRGLRPHFTATPHLFVESDENGQFSLRELLLTPFVRKGTVLASSGLSVEPRNGTDIFGREFLCPFPLEQIIVPGENVAIESESHQLIASASGYPVFIPAAEGPVAHVSLCVDRLISFTADRMQALLNLRPVVDGHQLPDLDTIYQVIDEEQVVFGLLRHVVEQSMERCIRDNRPVQATIALGTLPIKGENAWLRYVLEVGSMPGKVMGNGEIDFRERNMFIGVKQHQLIAQKVPATIGVTGKNVFGAVIEPPPGQDITVRAMDDAFLDEKTGEIRALCSGVLSVVTENAVKVCSHQVVTQDIDYATGNIFTRDAVEIKGSIKPKFKVSALGDVLITGDVENGQIRSDGTIVIKGGVTGKYATVRSHGDVDVVFAIQGRITSGSKILLRNHASYCRLFASGDLHCNPSSRIIAAQLVAFGSITVGSVGSDIAMPSLLAAAVDPEQLQLFFELRRTLAEQGKAIAAMHRHQRASKETEELLELLESHAECQQQFDNLNLMIPRGQEPSDYWLAHALACTIVVKGKVFSGTEIRLGNSRMILPITMSNICFRLQEHIEPDTHKRPILIIPNKK